MAVRKCFLCGEYHETEKHHIFGGSRKPASEKYKLYVYLCGEKCHRNGPGSVQNNKEVMKKLHVYGQLKFMREQNATIDDFRKIFYINYLEENE